MSRENGWLYLGAKAVAGTEVLLLIYPDFVSDRRGVTGHKTILFSVGANPTLRYVSSIAELTGVCGVLVCGYDKYDET